MARLQQFYDPPSAVQKLSGTPSATSTALSTGNRYTLSAVAGLYFTITIAGTTAAVTDTYLGAGSVFPFTAAGPVRVSVISANGSDAVLATVSLVG